MIELYAFCEVSILLTVEFISGEKMKLELAITDR